MGGKIVMYLDQYIMENGVSSDYPIFGNDISFKTFVSTNDLFLSQYFNDDYNAMDICVKYMAIENFYGLNEFGFDLYHKLQKFRINKDWNNRFKTLIMSVENGFDKNSCIETDYNYSIHDGSHRLALGIFNGLPNLPVKIFNTDIARRTYNMDWIESQRFTSFEIDTIRNKHQELLSMMRKPYFCILWTPARKYFDNISKCIANGFEGVHLLSKKDIYISTENFKKFIYDVYNTDDISTEKLNLKYNHLIKSLMADDYCNDNGYIISVLQILIDNPDFRMKPISGLPQSKTTMKIKREIRNQFMDKISEYYWDIIIHITDNQKQNDEIQKILKKRRG